MLLPASASTGPHDMDDTTAIHTSIETAAVVRARTSPNPWVGASHERSLVLKQRRFALLRSVYEYLPTYLPREAP